MNRQSAFLFGGVLAAAACIAANPVLDATNDFGLRTFSNCNVAISNGLLVVTDIAYDSQIFIHPKPFFTGDVTGMEYKYRATGTGGGGGELFYTASGVTFSGNCLWRLPPMKADGQWHVNTVGTNAIVSIDDWLNKGLLENIRFDPINKEGGRIEIEYIRFLGAADDSARTAGAGLDPETIRSLDADPWPEIRPETWSSRYMPVSQTSAKPVRARCFGGVASPSSARGGETIRLMYDFSGGEPVFPLTASIFLVDDASDTVRSEERIRLEPTAFSHLSADIWRVAFDYRLPKCLDAFSARVRFVMNGVSYFGGDMPEATLRYRRAGAHVFGDKAPVMGIRSDGKSACFTMDGKPFFILWGGVASRNRPDKRCRHSSAPLNMVTVYNEVSEWWPATDAFVPTCFDRQAEKYLRENPDAYFMWDLSIYPPADWCRDHPDEMCHDQSGRIVTDGRPSFSLASVEAIDAMEKAMERAIRYLESSPYANRIVGYRVNSGHTIEWLGWDPPRDKDTTLDFSKAAQKGFARWAATRYPALTDFSVPTLAERRDLGGIELTWTPAEHLRTVAYHDFLSNVTVDDLIRMCRRAKELVGGRKLVGTYYGYVMTLWSGGFQQIRSHYALKRLLDAKAVDFLMSPQPYGIRALGDPVGDMKPFASMAANGIVPVIEDDTRTHNSVYLTRSGNSQTLTCAQTTGVLRRNAAFALCRNQMPYFYALCAGTEFDSPRCAADFALVRTTGERCLANGSRRTAEIAYVVSEETIKNMPMLKVRAGRTGEKVQTYRKDGKVDIHDVHAVPFAGNLFTQAYKRLARIGAPVDYLLLEDLKDHPGDYRMYIFANAYRTDPAFAETVRKLRGRGATIVWVGPSGYMADGGNSTTAMEKLTGFRFEKLDGLHEPVVTMADGRKMGMTGIKIAPLFAVSGADEALGMYANGKVAVAVRKDGTSTSVYVGVDQLDVPFLRDIASRAGVHVFSDSTDPLEANENLVALHARFAGEKTIRLKGRTDVVDVFSRRLVGKDIDSFKFNATLHSSHLFYCGGDAERLLEDL